MKSFFTWIAAMIMGGALGYGATHVFDASIYLLIGVGVLIGSSIGITLNIHREEEEPESIPDDGSET